VFLSFFFFHRVVIYAIYFIISFKYHVFESQQVWIFYFPIETCINCAIFPIIFLTALFCQLFLKKLVSKAIIPIKKICFGTSLRCYYININRHIRRGHCFTVNSPYILSWIFIYEQFVPLIFFLSSSYKIFSIWLWKFVFLLS